MKVISKYLEDGHVWLDCLATAKEVNQAFDKCAIAFATRMGLRPEQGKSVAQVAEERLGIKDLDSLIGDSVVEYFGPMAVSKRGIVPACPPIPTPMGPLVRGAEFAFRLLVLPKPTFELSSYDPVTIEASRLKPEPEKVQQLLDQVTSQFASLATSESQHPVKTGDTVLLKMESKLNGEPSPGMTFERRPYVVGQGYMPEPFDQNLLGMEIGQTKSFSFESPSMFSTEEGATDSFECTVTVLEQQSTVTPELNDDFVKRFLPSYENAQALIDAAEKQVADELEYQQQDMLQQLATQELAGRLEGTIPDEVYESSMITMRENVTQSLAQQGKTLEEYTQEMGGEQQLTMMLMLEVRQNLSQMYALDTLYRHEKLKITEDDLDHVCRVMGSQDVKAARAEMESTGRGFVLQEAAERYCAAKWAVEHANIIYTDEK